MIRANDRLSTIRAVVVQRHDNNGSALTDKSVPLPTKPDARQDAGRDPKHVVESADVAVVLAPVTIVTRSQL
jgi:hypothetical protein